VSAYVFYDDFLVCGNSKSDTEKAMETLLAMLERIGIRINYEKTLKKATQTIEWLGLSLSIKTLSIPRSKKDLLRDSFNELMSKP
jgi:hypothetical protein